MDERFSYHVIYLCSSGVEGSKSGIFAQVFFSLPSNEDGRHLKSPRNFLLPLVSLKLFSYIRNWHRLTSRMVKLVKNSVHFIQLRSLQPDNHLLPGNFLGCTFCLAIAVLIQGTVARAQNRLENFTGYSNGQCHQASRCKHQSYFPAMSPFFRRRSVQTYSSSNSKRAREHSRFLST